MTQSLAGAAVVGFALALALSACIPPKTVRVPPRDPPAAVDLLPADLDFVVRIDSGRVRGNPMFSGASRKLVTESSSGILRSVLPLLEQSRCLMVGGRLMDDGFRGDAVVAIDLLPSADRPRPLPFEGASFHAVSGAPAGAEVLERSSRRDEAGLEVLLEHGVVLSTPAEIDSVLRVLGHGADADRLDPPARSLLSFAGRVRGSHLALGEVEGASAGVLRTVGEGLSRYVGTVDASDDGFLIEGELTYRSAEAAQRANQSIEQLLTRLKTLPARFVSYQVLADSAKLALAEATLRVRATVPFALLAGVH